MKKRKTPQAQPGPTDQMNWQAPAPAPPHRGNQWTQQQTQTPPHSNRANKTLEAGEGAACSQTKLKNTTTYTIVFPAGTTSTILVCIVHQQNHIMTHMRGEITPISFPMCRWLPNTSPGRLHQLHTQRLAIQLHQWVTRRAAPAQVWNTTRMPLLHDIHCFTPKALD